MDRYLSYAEYTAYGGSLTESEFNLSEFRAQKHIDYLTDKRVAGMSTVPEEVKLCIMSLINLDSKFGLDAQLDKASVSGDIKSFNTDGYSESYVGAGESASNAVSFTEQANQLIREMLYGVLNDEGVPLLYRGLDL